jgi:diacylglycerol kinase family enzyme
MAIRVLVNRLAGETVVGPAHLGREAMVERFREQGMDADVAWVEPEALESELIKARDGNWESVVIGGGDGTVNTAARILAGSDTPLAILPMGTFNYFARFLDLPMDVEQAIASLASASSERYDLVEVNGRIFLSHSAIGTFPHYIMERIILQRKYGLSKIPAMLLGIARTLLHHQVLVMTTVIEGSSRIVPTPSLVVGNNAGVLSPLYGPGETRESLKDGKFTLFLGRRLSRWATAWSWARSFLGRVDVHKDWERLDIEHCTIDAPRKTVLVTVDGELAIMQPPLTYRIRPSLLRLLVPAR